MPTLGFWSDAREFNPFQDLLYSEKEKFNFSVHPVHDPFSIPEEVDVIHFHWIEGLKFFYGRKFIQVELFIWLGVNRLFKGIGSKRFKIVTIHNFSNHGEEGNIRQHKRFMKRVLKKFDFVHFLSEDSHREFIKYLGFEFSSSVTFIGKHPNYGDSYHNNDSTLDVRNLLQIPKNGIVIGYVGGIKPYKNISLILEAYLNLKTFNPDLYLFIAGDSQDELFSDRIMSSQKSDDCIKYLPGHVLNNKIRHYFNVLDMAIFPFKDQGEILNSGSIILALSFSVVSLVPDLETLSGIRRLSLVKEYKSGDLNSLIEAIQNEIKIRKTKRKSDEVSVPVDMKSWLEETSPKRISKEFFYAVEKVLKNGTRFVE